MARGSIQVGSGPPGVAYRMRAEYRPDPLSGRRKQRSRTFLNRRDAEVHLTRWHAEIERGIAIEPQSVTVGEHLHNCLLANGRMLHGAPDRELEPEPSRVTGPVDWVLVRIAGSSGAGELLAGACVIGMVLLCSVLLALL